jgi:hypothetical protein
MIQLSPSDSSILTRVVQYTRIPVRQRLELLSGASKPARKIGRILLEIDKPTDAEPDVRAAADAFKRWLASNRRTVRPARTTIGPYANAR